MKKKIIQNLVLTSLDLLAPDIDVFIVKTKLYSRRSIIKAINEYDDLGIEFIASVLGNGIHSLKHTVDNSHILLHLGRIDS